MMKGLISFMVEVGLTEVACEQCSGSVCSVMKMVGGCDMELEEH